MLNYGFKGITQSIGYTSTIPNYNDVPYISVRVVDIILDNTHPNFNSLGKWNSIGSIEFELLDKKSNPSYKLWAKPLFSNIKNYPLINEIVLLFKAPNTNIDNMINSISYYYLPPTNIWSSSHHNAYPNPLSKEALDLNSPQSEKTFVEKVDIHDILPFAGDVIFSGRFGNSLRFGSTVKNGYNNWSSSGENGDPITILRNGQPLNSSESWDPQVEDINEDLSSIYFTSTQKINVKNLYKDFSSFSSTIIDPKEYNKPQIILRSGRLLFSSKDDGILLDGNKFISLNSYGEIGFNTRKSITFNSSKVNLGSKDASQQLLLGNKTIYQLDLLIQSLITIVETLELTLKYFPGGNESPHPAKIPLGLQKDLLQDILKNIQNNSLLSKISRTV
jgi:hypothetical protein